MAKVTNLSGQEDVAGVPKTYYLRIKAFGRDFYKFGHTGQRIADRFKKEPLACEIEIVDLWLHKTLTQALVLEARLDRKYRKAGFLPYIGKVGPLRGGGNTEVYTHDVLGGEPAPETVLIRAWSERGWDESHRFAPQFDPYAPFSYRPFWVENYYAPATPSLLMPQQSRDGKLVVADYGYLTEDCPHFSARSVRAALDLSYWVTTYETLANDTYGGRLIGN